MRKLPRNELYQLYVEKFYTYGDLAKYFRCSKRTIRSNIELYGIPKLPKGNTLARSLKMSDSKLKTLLYELHWVQGMSLSKIAIYLGTKCETISIAFKRLDVEYRPNGRIKNEI